MSDTGPLTEQELAERISAIRGSWRNGEWGKAKGWADALVADVIADRDALSSSLLAAQEALRQYGKHKLDCALYSHSPHGRPLPCNCGLDALLGVSAEPLKDTERATASQSPVAEECICPGEDTRLGNCPRHGQRGWSNVPVAKTGVGANVCMECGGRGTVDGAEETRVPRGGDGTDTKRRPADDPRESARVGNSSAPSTRPLFDPHPTRLAVDANGYVWRAYEGGYWSMAPVNPDNEPVPEPVTYYEPAADVRRDFAWLIERGQAEHHAPIVWWTGNEAIGWGGWTTYAAWAIRYATKGAAESVIAEKFRAAHAADDATARAVEHVFVSPGGLDTCAECAPHGGPCPHVGAAVNALDLHKAEIQRLRELVCECGHALDFEGRYVPTDLHDEGCPARPAEPPAEAEPEETT